MSDTISLEGKQYLLFDLDRTLWDFEGNADITFAKMYSQFALQELVGVDCATFHQQYRIVNDQLWEAYRNGSITKEMLNIRRFSIPLEYFGLREGVIPLSLRLGDFYVHEGPKQKGLMPGARHLLDYLSQKSDYSLCIITNGFSEAQIPKMHSSDIYRYFNHFFLSEEVGYMKPNPRFFLATLERLGASPQDCVVIGDDYNVDIVGASHAGIPTIFYNFQGRYQGPQPHKPSIEVYALSEIEHIL